jgi:hypothetical protein
MKTVTFDEAKWKLVPVEPTDAMVDAACPVGEAVDHFDMKTALREAIAAATAPAPSCGDAEQADGAVDAFLAEVRAELIRARAKFPGDRIMTIALAEEFGELCKAVLDESAANVRKEAVQTAVMCARVVLDGDGSVNDWRAERGLDPLVKDSK